MVIIVSGVGTPLNGVAWPSGQFDPSVPGSQLPAFLSSLNATFGFNINPHSFECEWIPFGKTETFHGASGQLPPIGHPVEFYVGQFLVRGNIVHADWTTSTNGTVFKTTIQDDRTKLRRIKIHSEDLGEDIPSGVVSVARAYRKINKLKDELGIVLDENAKEYQRILQFGCTYGQMLQAIDYTFNEGKLYLPVTEFPQPQQIEQNIGASGSIDSIRFQFNLDTMDEALTRVLDDSGYDWYWSLDAQKTNIINKTLTFEINEEQILGLVANTAGIPDLNSTTSIGFGHDVIPDPTRFRILGGHQEGFINSKLLSPIDGISTEELDNKAIFVKAWDKLSIGFYDADGFYRTYIPSEKELQLALAGIEQWSYFKKYQTLPASNTPPGYGLDPDAGNVAAQHPTFQSRLDPVMPLAAFATGAAESGLRIISNRRDAENNWTLAWYNRVQNHASTHYGRSFVCSNLLFNEPSGYFRLLDSAWGNIENQIEGYPLSPYGVVISSGLFQEDYEINRALGPISPFVTSDFKITSHVVLPADTIYGPQGDDVPASFGNWTEDAPPFNPIGDGSHYVPCSLTLVGQRVINPRDEEDLYGFEAYPEGTIWCQLPINAGPSGGLLEDQIIKNLATLTNTYSKISASGLLDLINPAKVLNCYQTLSGVAIPIESRTRYGQSYPQEWVSGVLHYDRHEDVQLDDQFVPWAFSPQGNKTSLDVMTDRALRRIRGKISPNPYSRYADFSQVGLPILSFDSFANQNIGASGKYGEISHGISELNINFGIDGFATRYKIQSYYPKFGREAPRGERVRVQLNGILNPIDFTDLDLLNPLPEESRRPELPGDSYPSLVFADSEQRAVRCTIIEVNDVQTLLSGPSTNQERYRGRDINKYIKPAFNISSPALDFQRGAICIDGFLNVGDEAMYHTDEFLVPGGSLITRYFTQGRPFANGVVVQVEQNNANDSSKYDVTIVDPTAATPRAIFGVEVLNGTVAIGDRTSLVAAGNSPVVPGESEGQLFINGTTTGGAGVKPVEIISVLNQGQKNALAICREITLASNYESNGNMIPSGNYYYNTIPIPYPQFAASGDRGFLTTINIPSGGFGQTQLVNVIEIITPAFRRFQP
jgi:hypothetical protein